jgi:death-on-curing protein
VIELVQILALHDRIIEKTGGSFGVRDEAGLASAVARPFQTSGGNDLYPSAHEKAAALLHSICNNHPFVDGNKRTAIVAAAFLLHRGGISVEVPTEEGEAFMLEVAQGRHDMSAIAKRLAGWTV